jgi:hypothetical protein
MPTLVKYRNLLALVLLVGIARAASAQTEAAPAPPIPVPPLSAAAPPTFKPGLLLQGWYLLDDAAAVQNTFRVRRAELSARGEILPGRFAYGLMFDLARLLEFQDRALPVTPATPGAMPETVTAKQPVGASSVLQDVFITLVTSWADLSIGQFKIPVSYEGYNPSSKLLFAERALVSSRFGDRRDVGLRLAKQFTRFGYSAGLFNGSGGNATDTNEGKDGALRVEVYPVTGLLLAGVVYRSLTGRRKSGARDRLEGDLRFEWRRLLVQAEYIHGRDVAADPTGAVVTTRGHGLYAAFAAHVVQQLQAAVRFGYLDPSRAAGSDHRLAYEAVINHYLRQVEARLQLAFSHFRSPDPARPPQNVLILAAQAVY